MEKKLKRKEAIDVSDRPREGPYYVLSRFVDGKDYCDKEQEAWIWSIGKRKTDGVILASRQGDLYQNEAFECLFLR